MRGVILVTDFDWFSFLAARLDLDEVNFWRPSDTRTPRQLDPGMPMMFKLKKAHGGFIVGCAMFARHRVMTAELAWDCFGDLNGAESFEEMLRRIDRLRPRTDTTTGRPGTFEIGCLMLSQPVFLPREDWISQPSDWPENAVQGSAYDLSSGEGARVWHEMLAATADRGAFGRHSAVGLPRYGEAVPVRPRLGQGTFRIAVLDAYGGACAVTGEHSVPALEAAHIRPFASDGPRDVTNGLLLRSDLHRLYDKGYVGVDRDYRFIVSERLRQDYSNGRSYYPLAGNQIVVPSKPSEQPDRVQLVWHLENVFRD